MLRQITGGAAYWIIRFPDDDIFALPATQLQFGPNMNLPSPSR
jgi:hypothetical protein